MARTKTPKRPDLRFRIKVAGTRFLRIHVSETHEDMWLALERCHGVPHRHEHAATVYFPGSPDHGCVADLFFCWRVLRPWIVAHEAEHAAVAIAVALKRGLTYELDDEFVATWTERVTEKIITRTQSAPL
jgi:hypothetical protein